MKTADRGAAYLDEVLPGWEQKIDLDGLDLGSGCGCVLGQLYRAEHPRAKAGQNAFARMLRELGLEWETSRKLGFLAWGNARYSNMTVAWRRLIKKRLTASA